MPYKWVKPKRLLRHKGVSIYYMYHDDRFDDEASYHYSTNEHSTNIDEYEDAFNFDVRNFIRVPGETHVSAIKTAIDKGLIKGVSDA